MKKNINNEQNGFIMIKKVMTVEQLLSRPLWMMTGEEFILLLLNKENMLEKPKDEVTPEKHYEYGIQGIAKIFGCSIPTANRIKKSSIIDAAISQIGRKIVIDTELALKLANEAGTIKINKRRR